MDCKIKRFLKLLTQIFIFFEKRSKKNFYTEGVGSHGACSVGEITMLI